MRHPLLALPIFLAAVTSAHAAPPKPCDLLTPAQVQTVVGGTVASGESTAQGKMNICHFTDPNQSKDFRVEYIPMSFFNDIAGANGAAVARSEMVSCKSTPDRSCELVPGLGEVANYTVQSTAYSVAFIYHGYMVSITVESNMEMPGVKTPLIALARTVLAKF